MYNPTLPQVNQQQGNIPNKKKHEVSEIKLHEVASKIRGINWTDEKLRQMAFSFLEERRFDYEHQTIKDYLATFRHYSFLQLSDFEKSPALKFFISKANSNWNRATLQKHLQKISAFGNWLCNHHIIKQRFHLRISPKIKSLEINKLDI